MKIKVNMPLSGSKDPERGSGRGALSSNEVAEGGGREGRPRDPLVGGYILLPMIFFSGLLKAHIDMPAPMPRTVSRRKNDSFDQRV